MDPGEVGCEDTKLNYLAQDIVFRSFWVLVSNLGLHYLISQKVSAATEI
jgi:hypothetical protein